MRLDNELRSLCDQADGLIVVAGPRASGKSALLSEFVDVINSTRYDHVITIESQIRRVHEKRELLFALGRELADAGPHWQVVQSDIRCLDLEEASIDLLCTDHPYKEDAELDFALPFAFATVHEDDLPGLARRPRERLGQSVQKLLPS